MGKQFISCLLINYNTSNKCQKICNRFPHRCNTPEQIISALESDIPGLEMARDHYRGSVSCTYNDASQFALIFASSTLLKILEHDSTFMFFDATFHTCPRPFYQLLNIMVSYKGVVIPVFHCYMTCKASPLYEKIFLRLRALFNVKPVIANTDFESALTKSLRDVFDGVIVHGCMFHFDQAVFRCIMSPSMYFTFILFNN